MKSKEEIEQLAFLEYPRVINDPYNPMEDDNADERQIWINAYTQCQEDMAKDLQSILNNSVYVDFISKKEILKYINSLNKQD
jgi:hypothetical protein